VAGRQGLGISGELGDDIGGLVSEKIVKEMASVIDHVEADIVDAFAAYFFLPSQERCGRRRRLSACPATRRRRSN
jgi:hypothetical protein